jgi:valyl-tRNA synthetase
VAPWPRADARARAEAALEEFEAVQELISAVRALRGEYGVQPGQSVKIWTANTGPGEVFHRESGTIRRLARISELEHRPADSHLGAHAVLRDGTGVFMPAEGAFDAAREVERLQKEADRLSGLVASQQRKLANEQFTSRAPADVVQRERDKLKDWSEQLEELRRKLNGLVPA